MYTIVESNGGIFIGAVLNEEGETLIFDNEKEAWKWGEENCAFDWQVILI